MVAALPEDVRRAVVESYYPRLVAASDAARSRAQGAYAIASGIALALVAAGIFTKVSSAPAVVRWLTVAAVGAWLVAAYMFLRAVGPHGTRGELTETKNASEFVRYVLNAAKQERDEVDLRVHRAYWPTFIAIALTIATVVAVAAVHAPRRASVVALSPAAQQAVQRLCPRAERLVRGRVATSALDSFWVTIRVSARECGHEVELRVPRRDVQAVAFQP